jgi:hypothetical protein
MERPWWLLPLVTRKVWPDMAMTCDRVRELASGFVLGALEPDEMIAVSDHLDGCAKPHPEIGELGGVLPYIAASVEPIEPAAWLRESIIAAAKDDLAIRRRVGKPSERRIAEPVAASAGPVSTGPAPAQGATVISIDRARTSRRRQILTWTTRVAAVVAIVALSGYSYILQGELAKAHAAQDHETAILNALTRPDTRTAQLSALDGSKAGGLAALRPTGHIIVNLHNLSATTGDEVYAIWLSADGGPAAKVGWFTVDGSGEGYLEVDNVPTSASLWLFVCKEPNANVTQPTGPKVVSGTISL